MEKISNVFVEYTKVGDWNFRTSISNNINIMIMAHRDGHSESFMIRFFTSSENAKGWVDEVLAGKHQDF